MEFKQEQINKSRKYKVKEIQLLIFLMLTIWGEISKMVNLVVIILIEKGGK